MPWQVYRYAQRLPPWPYRERFRCKSSVPENAVRCLCRRFSRNDSRDRFGVLGICRAQLDIGVDGLFGLRDLLLHHHPLPGFAFLGGNQSFLRIIPKDLQLLEHERQMFDVTGERLHVADVTLAKRGFPL